MRYLDELQLFGLRLIFSLKVNHAYLKLYNAYTLQEFMLFKNIWRWDDPKRIRFHLWKIGLGVLPANELRF